MLCFHSTVQAFINKQIKSDSTDIYNITKDFCFSLMLLFQTFY